MVSGRQNNKADKRHTGHAIGFKTIGRRAAGVAGIITGTIGNNPRIARIVFINFENNLHQIGTDIGNFGKNTAANTQRRSTQRFADGKTDKAGTGQITRHIN